METQQLTRAAVNYEAPMIVQQPKDQDIETRALSLVEVAKNLQVKTVQQRNKAAEWGVVIAGACKDTEEYFRPMKQAAAATHKEICNKENAILKPLEEVKRYLSQQIGTFDIEAEKLRVAEEARLQELEHQKAHAEAQRIADDRAIQDAIELEAAGDKKGAEAVLNNPVPEPVHVAPVVLQSVVPKTAGTSGVKNWKFKIVDESLIPRKYLIVDEKAIAGVVRSLKDKTEIPGIEVYPEGGARFKAVK